MRKIICDVCGKELQPTEVWSRLSYKIDVKTVTKTGKETVRRITRNVDFCSPDCFKKFDVEAEATAKTVVSETASAQPVKCPDCGQELKSETALKIHRRLKHGK